MKITVNYGNTANIPDGLNYGGMKPFYNVSQEIDIQPGEDVKSVIQVTFDRLKYIVDSNLMKDMKHFKNIRYKCTCTPTYIDNKYIHAESCLSGTAEGR